MLYAKINHYRSSLRSHWLSIGSKCRFRQQSIGLQWYLIRSKYPAQHADSPAQAQTDRVPHPHNTTRSASTSKGPSLTTHTKEST